MPIPERTQFHILDIHCSACRRPYDDVADEPCAAAINNEHLRGGPIGERKKRGTNRGAITAIISTALATGTNG